MTDPIVDWLQKNGVPVTRHNYLTIAYMGAPPEELDAETSADLEDIFPEGNPEENVSDE